ncbi:hypothetical protein D1007_51779 [Hordeum vulgare]|nr:hypothetical protein D1007_51779 [Hordeum vulgare]
MSSTSSNPPVDLEKGVAGPAATANQFTVSAAMPSPSSDLPFDLDLEKGAAWPAATKEGEEQAVLNPRLVKYMLTLNSSHSIALAPANGNLGRDGDHASMSGYYKSFFCSHQG